MRRISVFVTILAVVLLGLFAAGRLGTTAQEDAAGAGFVGAWRFTDPAYDLPSLGSLTADGNFIVANLPVEPVYEGADFDMLLLSASHGVWEATGDDTADFTLVYLYVNDRGEHESTTTLGGTLTLSADGQSVAAEFGYNVRQPDGTVVHAATGTINGTRIGLVPMTDLLPAAGTPAS